MVTYSRVMKLRAFIISDNKSFIGDTLDIPPLKQKLDVVGGNISHAEVIAFAEELYIEYQDRYKNNKELWYAIKNNNYETHCVTQAWRGSLRRFIKKYKEVEG